MAQKMQLPRVGRARIQRFGGAPRARRGLGGNRRAQLWPFGLPDARLHDLPLMPLLMFAVIDAAALLYEPLSECAAFHCFTRAASPQL